MPTQRKIWQISCLVLASEPSQVYAKYIIILWDNKNVGEAWCSPQPIPKTNSAEGLSNIYYFMFSLFDCLLLRLVSCLKWCQELKQLVSLPLKTNPLQLQLCKYSQLESQIQIQILMKVEFGFTAIQLSVWSLVSHWQEKTILKNGENSSIC